MPAGLCLIHYSPARAFQARRGGGGGSITQFSITKLDVVLDLRHARCRPSCQLSLLTLGPGTNGATKDDLASLSFHCNPIRVELSATLQRLLDLCANLGR